MDQYIKKLEHDNAKLIEKVKLLEKKLSFFENHPILAKGIKGESIVLELLGGDSTTHNASYDIDIKNNNIKVEVKFSRLNIADRKMNNNTQRWAWFNVLGLITKKEYDLLILIGDADERYKAKYLEPESPYIFFMVPKNEVELLTISSNNGQARSIQLTTNPSKARSAAAPLFTEYQITTEKLEIMLGQEKL